MSDILAISSCKALIGSHSTFTDWGGYLGQLPILLPKKPHYGSFLNDLSIEFIIDVERPVIPQEFFEIFRCYLKALVNETNNQYNHTRL